MVGLERAATALEQPEGERGSFGLANLLATLLAALLLALLLALLQAQPKDLAVGHAAREVVGGDSTHGAVLGSGAAVKGLHQDSGDHIADLGIEAGAGSLGSNRLRAIGQLIFRQQQHTKGLLQEWGRWG